MRLHRSLKSFPRKEQQSKRREDDIFYVFNETTACTYAEDSTNGALEVFFKIIF